MANSAKNMRLIPGQQQGGNAGGLSAMDKKPYAPRDLSEVASDYWREYCRSLHESGMLFEIDLSLLKDLCRWEELKERAWRELPGPDKKLYLEYHSETGELTHVQSHAAFSNLRSIQSSINALREKMGLSLRDRSGMKIPAKKQNNNTFNKKSWT